MIELDFIISNLKFCELDAHPEVTNNKNKIVNRIKTYDLMRQC